MRRVPKIVVFLTAIWLLSALSSCCPTIPAALEASNPAQPLTLKWSFQMTGPSCDRVYADDLDGDGHKEVIAGAQIAENPYLYVINYDGTLKWKYQPGCCVLDVYAADLEGDGYKEVIAGSSDGYAYVFNYDGTLRWKYHIGACVTRVYADDLDGDGYKEVFAGDRLFNYQGELLWEAVGAYSVYMADLEGDGYKEFIIGSKSEQRVHVFNYNGTEKNGNIS